MNRHTKLKVITKVGFPALLAEVKERIQSAQARAIFAVNAELVRLYWDIGRIIEGRKAHEGWGAGVIPRLARKLHNDLPDLKGFSERNIKLMAQFSSEYPDAFGSRNQIGQPLVAQLPWAHNILLMQKFQDFNIRRWYMKQTLINGWSRNMLGLMIDAKAHLRHGKAVVNFHQRLPAPQSDLAKQTLKDPYIFDFLTLAEPFQEHKLEIGLIRHLEKFLLELGQGFAFIGRQFRLNVGDEDFYVDLLFYHLRLRAFVVIELKKGKFKPEYAGKLNFYCNVINDRLRHPSDQPTIGLILCQSRDRLLAEYSLTGIDQPIGISTYELTRALPPTLQSALPTVEQIESELGGEDGNLKSKDENPGQLFSVLKKIRNKSRPVKKILSLLSVLCPLAPSLSSAADWPMFRGNMERTGHIAEQAAPPLAQAWTFQAEGGIVSSPAVHDGKVYIGSRASRLYALDARTGALLWSRLTAGWVDSSPAVSGGLVYATCLGGRLYGIDRLNGDLRWIVDIGASSASSPLVLGGRVYIGTGSPDNKLKAYDAFTGAHMASFQAAQPVDSAPSTDGTFIYFGANDGQVHALHAATLAPRWPAYPTIGSFGQNAAAVFYGALYFLPGRDEKKASALNTGDGSLLAASPQLTKTGPWLQAGSPAITPSGKVYFAAAAVDAAEEPARLAALSADTLSAVWASSVPLGGISPIGVLASPVLANEVIYAATPGGRLIAVNSSGATLADMNLSSPAYSSPAVSNGMVVAANYGGRVFGFQAGRHAAISSPRGGDVINGTVPVRGWFAGPNLSGYELEYSAAGAVTGWTRVSSAAVSSPSTGAVIAHWGVTGLQNGEYLLRLRVLESVASGYNTSALIRVRVNAAPLPPSGLAAADAPNDGGNAIALSWTASPTAGVSAYRVYRDDGTGSRLSLLASTASVSFLDRTAVTGSTFAYAVSAWDGWAESARTDIVGAFSVNNAGDNIPPAAIKNFSAAPGAAGGYAWLTWTAPGNDGDVGTASHYLIRHSTDPAQDWGAFASLAGSSRTADSPAGSRESGDYGGLFGGVTYYFAIKAADQAGNTGALSNIASAWAARDPHPPPPPSGLSVTDVPGDEGGALDLRWTLSPDDGAGRAGPLTGANDVYGYKLFRRTLNEAFGPAPYASVGAGISSYRDTAAALNVRYHYAVAAFDSTNDSVLSGEASAASADNWRFLDAAGGALVRLADGMEIAIPAGASSQNDKLMVTRLEPVSYRPLFAAGVSGGRARPTDIVYEVKFRNPATRLSAPATITMPYTDADVAGMQLENLRVYRYTDGGWAMLNVSSVDERAKTISAEVSRFSAFRVMEYLPSGAVIGADEVYSYPNPARGGAVRFKFRPAYKAHVAIDVYNVAGEKVARFERADSPAGAASEIEWNISGVASGVYVYRVEVRTSAGSKTVTKKLAIIH